MEALNINSSTKGAPDIVLRPYTWKGEQWLAIYIDGERTALRAGWPAIQWLRNTLDAELINGGEARNPEYFKRLGMQTDPPPLQKPMAGVIRHPHQRDDGTWIVGPSRSEGATWEDAVSGSSDSSSPDGP